MTINCENCAVMEEALFTEEQIDNGAEVICTKCLDELGRDSRVPYHEE